MEWIYTCCPIGSSQSTTRIQQQNTPYTSSLNCSLECHICKYVMERKKQTLNWVHICLDNILTQKAEPELRMLPI